ncbi:hypothetical protein [Streptomyces chartreusis]
MNLVQVLIQLLITALGMGFNQLFQSRYGPLGVLCLFLLGIGFRTRDTTCLCVGTVLVVILMSQDWH